MGTSTLEQVEERNVGVTVQASWLEFWGDLDEFGTPFTFSFSADSEYKAYQRILEAMPSSFTTYHRTFDRIQKSLRTIMNGRLFIGHQELVDFLENEVKQTCIICGKGFFPATAPPKARREEFCSTKCWVHLHGEP